MSKKNKYALITGAGGLLGPEHASALAEEGYNLILVDIDKKNLELKSKRLKKKFKKIKILNFVCDISREEEVINLKNELQKKNIFIKVLINNAEKDPKMNSETRESGSLENYQIEELQESLSVGVIGTVICSKIFGTLMASKKNGSIINISSDLGVNAPDQRVYHSSENIKKVKIFKPIGYSISKHAISGITKYIATYWAHKNIRCNTLVLGAVIHAQSKSLIKNIKKRVPLNRLAKKSEYREAIKFLASDKSQYMTGQSLIMDGGITVW